MAKILSPIWSVIRGSIGGITYTANQFHQIIARAKTAPVNPNTTKQTAIRSAFSGAVQLWNGLTDTGRQNWNDYANTLVFEGPLGPYSVPGRDVFIANISVALFLNAELGTPAAVVTTAPTIAGFLNVENVSVATFVTAGKTGIAYSFTQNGTEDVIGYAQRSFAFGASRARFKGQFLSNTLSGITIVAPASGTDTFEDLVEDLVYFMNPRFITAQAPFRLSARFFLRAIAVTNV